MPIRVELIGDAVKDLVNYSQTGNIRLFLQKLIRLENAGKSAGLPLGRGLSGYFKIVVGDRDWRIVYDVDRAETVATVVVIGDRADAACYEQAQKRLASLEPQSPATISLAAAMLELPQLQKRKSRS